MPSQSPSRRSLKKAHLKAERRRAAHRLEADTHPHRRDGFFLGAVGLIAAFGTVFLAGLLSAYAFYSMKKPPLVAAIPSPVALPVLSSGRICWRPATFRRRDRLRTASHPIRPLSSLMPSCVALTARRPGRGTILAARRCRQSSGRRAPPLGFDTTRYAVRKAGGVIIRLRHGARGLGTRRSQARSSCTVLPCKTRRGRTRRSTKQCARTAAFSAGKSKRSMQRLRTSDRTLEPVNSKMSGASERLLRMVLVALATVVSAKPVDRG